MNCQTENLQDSDFLKTKDLMKMKADENKKPNPRGGKTYQDENWIDFIVQQKKKQIRLQTYRTSPNQQNKQDTQCILVLFHGLCNHTNNSAHVADYLSQQGITTVAFDFRGFGKSEGTEGIIDNEEQHIDDCEKFIELVGQQYPGKKIFIGGQSLGGLTCFLLGLKNPGKYAGTIMFAPALKDIGDHQSFSKKFLGLASCLLPNVGVATMDAKVDTKNVQVQEDLTKDPLVQKAGKSLTVNFIVNKMKTLHSQFVNFKEPFLLIQGKVDKQVNASQAKDLMEKSPSKDKQLLFYPNLWHNIILEEEIHDILPKLSKWILDRL